MFYGSFLVSLDIILIKELKAKDRCRLLCTPLSLWKAVCSANGQGPAKRVRDHAVCAAPKSVCFHVVTAVLLGDTGTLIRLIFSQTLTP